MQLQRDARLSGQWFEHVPRYIDLPPEVFFTILRDRRSPLLAHIPPGLYYQLHRATQEYAVVRGVRHRVGRMALAVSGRRTAV